MENEYFKQYTRGQGGDYIFWIAQALPLVLWVFLIKKYYYDTGMTKRNIYVNYFTIIPFLGVAYNIYLSWKDKPPTLPATWGFCLSTDVPAHLKDHGVVGLYDFSCYRHQVNSSYSLIKSFISRLYYINYILFFIILVVQNNYFKLSGLKKKNHSVLINLICISAILGIIGSLCPLFGQSDPIWTYIALRFFSSILWMSASMLIIFLVNLYFFTRPQRAT